MTVDTVDVFSPVELYLLLSPLETKYLFGIPDKLTFLLKGEDVFAEGFERLKSKGILTDTGELTDGGGFLIESLMEYHQSKKYVRMNQLMFAFSEKASNEVLVMIEVTSQKEYRFERMNKIYALAMIKDFFRLLIENQAKERQNF